MHEIANQPALIRQYLADRTIGCPVCGYNLRNAGGQSCPECGTELQLHLGTLNPRLGWWMVGLLAVALPLGFASILAGTATIGAWQSAFWRESDWWVFGALCGLTLLYSMFLVALIRRRGKFLRMSRLEQRVRAIGVALIMLAAQVATLYLFAQYSRF